MELEHLQLKTVELLTEKCSIYGLPLCEDDTEDEMEDCGEVVLADQLSAALKEAKEQELPLLERLEAPEVVGLRSNMQRLVDLKERMGTCHSIMSDLRTSYQSVTARTSSLHDACDRALAHQTALAAGAEQIRANLHFFKQADVIMKKLNNTAKLSVTGQSFAAMLASIDECLTFLSQHPEYHEAALYKAKYEQCLSRAMTWIRVGVLNDLEASVNDVRERQAQLQVDYAKLGRGGADDDTFALLYGVFASRANSIRTAFSIAEQRFSQVQEFQAMLSECQNAYFSTRQTLLNPIIQSTLQALSTTHMDSSCALTRSGCSFVLRVCDDEYRLYRQFFTVDEGGSSSPIRGRISPSASISSHIIQPDGIVHPFEEFTEGFCRLLYDILRPIVIHNPHLETLAELCTILRVEMIEERCSLMSSIVGDENSSFDPRAGFVHVMGELVGDVAERIVHRAALYGQSDIAGYKPAAGDLAYPEKLEMMRDIELSKKSSTVPQTETNGTETNGDVPQQESDASTSILPKVSSSSAPPISAVDLHCLWYPTVRRTVMCLAKLFKCLDMGVFQSLARDLLSMCCDSLQSAAQLIASTPSAKSGRNKILDAELFVVKHLLILREQTTPYRQAASHRADATLPTRDFSIDFSKMRSSLMDDKSRWFELSSNNAFLELLLSVPIHVSEQVGDSRRVIDTQLRNRCNQLITVSVNMVIGQLSQFVDKAEDEALKSDFDLKNHPELSPSKLNELSSISLKSVGKVWPELRKVYSLYIGVNETESILLSPVRKRIIDIWVRCNSFATKIYDEEGKSIAALPSIQQIYLLLNKE